jgi:hypothetical protein
MPRTHVTRHRNAAGRFISAGRARQLTGTARYWRTVREVAKHTLTIGQARAIVHGRHLHTAAEAKRLFRTFGYDDWIDRDWSDDDDLDLEGSANYITGEQ